MACGTGRSLAISSVTESLQPAHSASATRALPTTATAKRSTEREHTRDPPQPQTADVAAGAGGLLCNIGLDLDDDMERRPKPGDPFLYEREGLVVDRRGGHGGGLDLKRERS